MTWPAEGTQLYSQARPLAFSAPLPLWSWADAQRRIQAGAQSSALCTLCDVSWASQRWKIPASPTELCREALDKVNLARVKGSLWLWTGLKCPELTRTHQHHPPPQSVLLLANWGPHWVLPKTPEQGHCHGKRAADRTYTEMHSTPWQL